MQNCVKFSLNIPSLFRRFLETIFCERSPFIILEKKREFWVFVPGSFRR